MGDREEGDGRKGVTDTERERETGGAGRDKQTGRGGRDKQTNINCEGQSHKTVSINYF